MPPVVIVAAAAVAASLPLLWWAVASTRNPTKSVVRNLAGGESGVADMREILLTRSASERAVQPLLAWLAERARALTPGGLLRSLERRILLAGKSATWPLERVLAAKLLLALGGAGLGMLLIITELSGGRALLAVILAVGGFFAPELVLMRQARERQAKIRLLLPDTLDQITISVEAGLGFDAALARAGRTGDGPLAQELIRTMQEVQIGVSRERALRNLAARTDVTDLRQFVLAIVQAESYGIPVAQVLRVQASELRIKRRQRAEERAMKIPVKVVVPLIVCILPSLFIVLVGPAMLRISRSVIFGG